MPGERSRPLRLARAVLKRTPVAAFIATTIGLCALAVQASAAPVPEDAFAPCYPKGRPIECGLLDQLVTQCVVAEERFQHQEKLTRRCEAAVIGQRHIAAELITDPKARQAALDDVAVLADRLARTVGVALTPGIRKSAFPGYARSAIGAQSGPNIYSSSECLGAIVNAQCQGETVPEGSYHMICHGEVVDGVCTGPIF